MTGLSSDYRYHKKWRYDRAQGRTRMTDSTRARLHVAACVGAGMSMSAIAAAAGVSPQVVSNLHKGQASIRRVNEAKLLAVKPGVTSAARHDVTEPFVPAIGTRRRIRALLAVGWRHSDISAAAGHLSANTLHQQGRWVTKSVHDDYAATYRDLAFRPGPSERTRQWAKKLGYAGPMDWDDIDADPEPQGDAQADKSRRFEEVDPVVIERVLAGDWSLAAAANPAEREKIVAGWTARDRPLTELERRTGWQVHRYTRKEQVA